MTNTALPEIRQTLPGRSRPYRLYTVDYVGFDTFYGIHPMVVTDGWGCSRAQTYGEPEVTLNVYRVPFDADNAEHPLNKTVYLSEVAAKRAAFEAGITAFMVYTDKED